MRCCGPLSNEEWQTAAEQHCVAGKTLPYRHSTYAWEMASPVRFSAPVPYEQKRGTVVWAKA